MVPGSLAEQPGGEERRPRTGAAATTSHNSGRPGRPGPGVRARPRFGEAPAWRPASRGGRRAPRDSRRRGRGGGGGRGRSRGDRRRGGSRTYLVGLPRRPGVTAGRGGGAGGGGGGPAGGGGGGRRAGDGDARPLRRPQPLPGSLTPGARRRAGAGHSPSVNLHRVLGGNQLFGAIPRGREGERVGVGTEEPSVSPGAERAAPAPPPPARPRPAHTQAPPLRQTPPPYRRRWAPGYRRRLRVGGF